MRGGRCLMFSLVAVSACSGLVTAGSSDGDAGGDARSVDASDAAQIRDTAIDQGPFWKPRDGGGASCSKLEPLEQPESCDAGWYLWNDTAGGYVPGSGFALVGDNRCYLRCSRDDECTDPERPFCSIQGLNRGGDYACNGAVRICRCKPRDDCKTEKP